MPKPRSANLAVYNVRLLRSLDKLLRDKPRYAGELSTSINDALLAVDLGMVELVKLHSREKQTGRETQVVILRRLRKRIHDVARKRNCSMNQLVNSALLAYYEQGGKTKRRNRRDGQSAGLYDNMSEAERRALHHAFSGFFEMKAVAISGEEPDGVHYEYDRNLGVTVRVTPDGERTAVQEGAFVVPAEKAKRLKRREGERKLSTKKPGLYIVAGPVGAGKATFYDAYLKEAFPKLVPPLRHLQQPFLDERRSFAVQDICVDTQLLQEARAAGYATTVLFISTEDPKLNLGRVIVRVSQGGQAIPVSCVLDSYRESMKNLAEVPKYADELIVYDNTAHGRGFRVVAQFIGGNLKEAAQVKPEWVVKAFRKELPLHEHGRVGRVR